MNTVKTPLCEIKTETNPVQIKLVLIRFWSSATAASAFYLITHMCVVKLCGTHSLSRANLLRLSKNSVLPPWWKCRAGREVDDSFSLKTRKVQPSSFTVMDLSSLTLKVNAHLLLSWLWFREPDRPGTGIRTLTGTILQYYNCRCSSSAHCFIRQLKEPPQ